MPTTASDREVLAFAAFLIAGGLLLIGAGLLLHPPLALARRLATLAT